MFQLPSRLLSALFGAACRNLALQGANVQVWTKMIL